MVYDYYENLFENAVLLLTTRSVVLSCFSWLFVETR